MKFEVEAADLDYHLRTIKLFASTDSMTPVLAVIRFKVGAEVVLDATDRYSLGQSRITRTDDGTGEAVFLLPVDSLKVILPALKGRKGPVWVEHEDGRISVAGVSVGEAEGDFPRVENLWPKELTDQPAQFALAPFMVKKLGKITPKDRADKAPFEVFAGPESKKPVVIMRGADFRALAMPVTNRYGAEAPDYGSWAAV